MTCARECESSLHMCLAKLSREFFYCAVGYYRPSADGDMSSVFFCAFVVGISTSMRLVVRHGFLGFLFCVSGHYRRIFTEFREG